MLYLYEVYLVCMKGLPVSVGAFTHIDMVWVSVKCKDYKCAHIDEVGESAYVRKNTTHMPQYVLILYAYGQYRGLLRRCHCFDCMHVCIFVRF